jgi:pimeloyl-ACP methyl ester carboxylesterase
MATFVLVHGAWSGAHGFRHVRRLLQQAGHEVFTPSLTGLGERAHLISPQVSLSTHIRDVVNHILYEDLNSIVLMGFSYGGFVVTGALEHVAERVRHLVYLDAFVPRSGETALGHIAGLGRAPIALGQDWLMPAADRQFDDAEEGAWIKPRRGPHPRACFTEPVYLAQPLEEYGNFSRTYIKATLDPETDVGAKQFLAAAQHAKASPAWRYEEIATTHMVASNQPQALAQLLMSVAAAA